MKRYAEGRVRALERLGLDGYILKSRSPSCGLRAVPVGPGGSGRGLFAAALVHQFPSLPIEEEWRLTDPAVRRRFLARVFATARRRLRASRG